MHERIANAVRVSCLYFNLHKDTPLLTYVDLEVFSGYQFHSLKVLAL